MSDPEGELWVDGYCLRLPDGTTSASYAITTLQTVVETARIPQKSAQAAELIALLRACELSQGLRVNIYTDSQYAFGVAHNFGKLWKERGFLTSHGSKIQHGKLVNSLLTALTLQKIVANIKCSAHKKVTDKVGQGNAFADEVARDTASALTSKVYVLGSQAESWENMYTEIKDIHQSATEQGRAEWQKEGELDDEGCWRSKNMSKWKLPYAYVLPFVTMAHGPAHVSAKNIISQLDPVWDSLVSQKNG